MIESVDEHLRRRLADWPDQERVEAPAPDAELDARLGELFAAQALSRHMDFAARRLQAAGEGFYTIGSAGHEGNAAVAMALRPDDPALLHYRSGGFYTARARQVRGHDAIRDVLSGVAALAEDPSGGRHKVFGHPDLAVIPQTSTISSQLPRAMGLAFSLGHGRPAGSPWAADAVVVASLGDASLNHSTALGALNAAGWCAHQGLDMPLLVVCEDNGIGISTPTPGGWTSAVIDGLPGFTVLRADSTDPIALLRTSAEAAELVRSTRRPVILQLATVRLMGHAGSDAELGYRTRKEILADYERDPLLATAAALIARGIADAPELLRRYERAGEMVAEVEAEMPGRRRLSEPEEVIAPLRHRDLEAEAAHLGRSIDAGTAEGEAPVVTLSGAITATLADLMAVDESILVFGEDVGRKGGVYGLTRGLRKRFGGARVLDTLLDEQTILGTALGAALDGRLPIPEIQYLAYLHNAEDQLRGEAASLRFFSNGAYANGMVVRVAGLAYQRGFGGHFHNDNSVAVLRDIPGLLLAVPSHPAEAPELLRALAAAASGSGRVGVFLEPIALYHTRDLHPGDGVWTAPYALPRRAPDPAAGIGRAIRHGTGRDLLLVTYGNGVRMSMLAAAELAQRGIEASVLDLRWLAPLPEADLLAAVADCDAVLVVDEGRRSGGVAEGVLAVLDDHGSETPRARICGEDSFIPLGPAAAAVLIQVEDVVQAALGLVRS